MNNVDIFMSDAIKFESKKDKYLKINKLNRVIELIKKKLSKYYAVAARKDIAI